MDHSKGIGTSIEIGALRVGERLSNDMYDGSGRLLLASGTIITDHFLEVLRSRGIRTVRTQGGAMEQAADKPGDAAASASKGDAAQRAFAADAPPDATAYALTDRPRPGKSRLDPDAFERASRDATQHAEQLMGAWEMQGGPWIEAVQPSHVSGGRSTRGLDAGPTTDLLHAVLPVMALDVDLAAVMANLSPAARHPILAHGVRTALVAMHLAQQIGYPEPRIIDAGLTGMLADIGMARLPEAVLTARRPLTPNEWLDVRRHPAYSADLLEDASVPKDVRVAIYQHHERLDGSGYPHGRKGFFLHPLARLVAVADVYAALSEPRSHRPAQSAHHAVKAVLMGVKAGSLDPVAGKLLVDTVGLFPVGSRVDVQSRTPDAGPTIPACVLRSPDDQPDRPFLVVLDERGQPTKKKIDLTVRDELRITKIYAPGEAAPIGGKSKAA